MLTPFEHYVDHSSQEEIASLEDLDPKYVTWEMKIFDILRQYSQELKKLQDLENKTGISTEKEESALNEQYSRMINAIREDFN